MTTEFNLSEKIHINNTNNNWTFIRIEDVKEFIRLLKEKVNGNPLNWCKINDEIDKLAGKSLIGKK